MITIESGGYTCTGNKLTIPSLQINTASASNVLKVKYNKQITEICDESDTAFLEAVGLVGMILTIILIGGAIAMLFLSFKGIINIDLRDYSWGEMLTGVMVIGLTFLLLATMAYLIGGSYCPAIGG